MISNDPPRFIERFPDEFEFACRMQYSPHKLSFYFGENDQYHVIGYIRCDDVPEKIKEAFVNYEGVSYALIFYSTISGDYILGAAHGHGNTIAVPLGQELDIPSYLSGALRLWCSEIYSVANVFSIIVTYPDGKRRQIGTLK